MINPLLLPVCTHHVVNSIVTWADGEWDTAVFLGKRRSVFVYAAEKPNGTL